jgi:hypothetical protein
MTPFSVDPIVKEAFSLTARHEGNAVFVKIIGNGDMETPMTLSSYLKKVHTEALRVRAHSVVVECDELYFMSSACIKCLVTWIDSIVKLDHADRYKVKFQANPNLPWQRRSFEALRRFAPALVHVDSDSASRTPAALQSGTMPQTALIGAGGEVAPGSPPPPAARRKP